MSATPILDAETVLATAVRDTLAPLVGTYNGRPKVYYQLAEQGAPLPFVVFQFQSDIARINRIGDIGATTLVTVKALAESAADARSLLATAAPGMGNLEYAGYTLSAVYLRSPILPPHGGVYQSAHIWRVAIERNP
jgi:hypothetical protein